MTPVEYLHLHLSRPIVEPWDTYSGRLTWTCYSWRKMLCANIMSKDYQRIGCEIDSGYCLDRQAIYDPRTSKPI